MVENRSWVQREGVYSWFSSLSSAQRAEFLCGLLDLCVPIELRFLGSCLEDLARKDYHSLRDADIRANNPADLSGLTNITDEVVRSKLLVSLALLSSDNREAAGVLYRTLTHIDTVINNYGLPLNDGRTEEQFLLLFTMASNHPAFSFHQKQVLRRELSQIHDILQVSNAGAGGGESQGAAPCGDCTGGCCAPHPCHPPQHPLSSPPVASLSPDAGALPCNTHCSCRHKSQASTGPGSGVTVGRGDPDLTPSHLDLPLPSPPPPPPPLLTSGQSQEGPGQVMGHQAKPGKVVVDRVVLRRVTQKSENSEYVFEASWSDASVSSVVKTQKEVMEFLSQLSQAFPDEGLEKGLPPSLELDPRCLTTLPFHILQHHSLQIFFSSPTALSSPSLPSSVPPLPSPPPSAPLPPAGSFPFSPNLSCVLQHRGTTRPGYGVASIQPVASVHSSFVTRPPPHLSSHPPHLPPCVPPPQNPPQLCSLSSPTPGQAAAKSVSPPCRVVAVGVDGLPPLQPGPQLHSPSHPQPATSTKPSTQCQSSLQSSTPEQNGILDWLRRLRLHKYYQVFKQLTMEEFLALTEEDLNKYDLTQGAKKKLKTQLELQNREMKMEKRYLGSQFAVSCSGIARVTPSSHMGTPPQHSSSPAGPDQAASAQVGSEKERSCVVLLGSSSLSISRPTAQVLPVQTDPVPSLPAPCSSQLLFNLPPSPHHVGFNPTRIMTSPRKPRPPPVCPEERGRALGGFCSGAGVGQGPVGVRLESLFPGLSVDSSPAPLQDSLVCGGLVGGLMVETSSSLTSTSNSLHHVSHPPLHFHLSSSPSPSAYYAYPSSSSTFPSPSFPSYASSPSAKSPFATVAPGSGVSVVPLPGNSYCPPPPPCSSPSPCPASSSSSSPSSLDGSAANQGPGHASSLCVCSSCGCRGNCGAYGAMPGYAAASYLQPFSAGSSLFTLGPLLHLSPLIATSSAASGAAPFSYPLVAPPPLYRHEQLQALYQPHDVVGTGGQKHAGSLSCYNCGASGHRAEDCKQPTMDAAQQGTFRLKYTPHSDSQDSGE